MALLWDGNGQHTNFSSQALRKEVDHGDASHKFFEKETDRYPTTQYAQNGKYPSAIHLD